MFKAWEVLHQAGRTGLKTKVEALEALTRLRALGSAKLERIGLTEEILPFIEGRRAYKDVLGDFEKLATKIDENPGTTVENFDGIIARLDQRNKLSGGSGYTPAQVKGADGVVRAFADDIDDYVGKKITFEKTVENARDLNSKSYEDLQVEIELPTGASGVFKRVEVKNCEGCVTSSVIKNQFIDRDLYNATSLNQIRWRIYGQSFGTDDLLTMMKANRDALNALPVSKKNLLFKNFDELEGVTDANITQFVNDNFAKIFL